jgi:hypothetical protein
LRLVDPRLGWRTALRIVTARGNAPVFAIAFATFILLLGSGLGPLPGDSEEAAITRVLNVEVATAYAAGALSLVQTVRFAWPGEACTRNAA